MRLRKECPGGELAGEGESLMKQEPQRTATLKRYLGLYGALWKNSLVREMQFKVNFLLWIVVEALWFALQLSFMTVLYTHTDSIAGWSKWEVVLLVGCNQFIQQLFTALFLTNITDLSEHIRTGRLDFMLLLPVNTRFLISLRKVDWGSYLNAALGLAVMAYAGRQLHLHPSPLQIAGFGVLSFAGVMIHYSLMFLLATISFWTVRAQGIVWGYYNLFNIARLPDTAFRGVYRMMFTWVLPVLLVSNVPARLILAKLESAQSVLLMLGLAAVCFGFSEVVWRWSLARYTSASS